MEEKRTITGYLKPLSKRIGVSLFVKGIGTVAELGLPWILAYIIDDVIPLNNINMVVVWGCIMIGLSLFAWAGNVLGNRLSSAVARDATRNIRKDLFHKILYLSNRDADNFTSASLISRMTTDTYIINQNIGMMQRLGIRAPILLFGGILITLTLDPVLTLVMLCAMPLACFVTFFVSRKGVKLYRIVQRAGDKMLMVVRENVTGVRVIKALSKDHYERKRFKEVNGDLTATEKKATVAMATIDPSMNAILNLGLVAVIIVGAYRIDAGNSETGNIIAFANYFTLVLQSVMAITRMVTMLAKAFASSTRIEEVLNCPRDLYELESKYEENEKDKKAPFIHFDNVEFKYNTGNFRLKNINIKVNKGETLGIIGATGSGKSTIIQALMRFYDVEKGEIKIDGINVKDYSTVELRNKFGVAFQNDSIFKDSIEENITFGREDAQVNKAITIAMAREFIEEKGGLQSEVVIKGANLSGGQKQRLLIARAVATSPEILILDDSSSALDYKTDAKMREEIREKMADTTKIIVAQRISSIMHAETIIVMDGGEIIGMGTHEYLMETCPLYKEIGVSQIGGEDNE